MYQATAIKIGEYRFGCWRVCEPGTKLAEIVVYTESFTNFLLRANPGIAHFGYPGHKGISRDDYGIFATLGWLLRRDILISWQRGVREWCLCCARCRFFPMLANQSVLSRAENGSPVWQSSVRQELNRGYTRVISTNNRLPSRKPSASRKSLIWAPELAPCQIIWEKCRSSKWVNYLPDA